MGVLCRRGPIAVGAWLVLLAVTGCGNRLPLVPASGKVMFEGKPVPSVAVQFIADADSGTRAPVARAATNADGSFELKCPPQGPGAVPGHYKVLVFSMTDPDQVPAQYAELSSTPLRAEVPESGVSDLVLTLVQE